MSWTKEAVHPYENEDRQLAYEIWKFRKPDGDKVLIPYVPLGDEEWMRSTGGSWMVLKPDGLRGSPTWQRIGEVGCDDPDTSPGVEGARWTPKVRPVLYRLPELMAAKVENPDRYLFVTGGETDADTLWNLGFAATTNPFGALNWDTSFNHYFRNSHVVVVEDNDETGRKRTRMLYEQLSG